MPALETLTDRNSEFAARRFRPGLRMMPALKTIVIGCVDPRVDPAAVLGLDDGDAAVVRNIGGRVTPATLQELGMLAQVGQAAGAPQGDDWTLVVLHHTDCGITRLAGDRDLLAAYLGVPAVDLDGKAVTDPRAAVAVDVDLLARSPGLPSNWLVRGLMYDVATGLVEEVVPPTRPQGA